MWVQVPPPAPVNFAKPSACAEGFFVQKAVYTVANDLDPKKKKAAMAKVTWNLIMDCGLYSIRRRVIPGGEYDGSCPVELVKWFDDDKSSCYALCMWRRTSEGYELHNVGSRLFDELDNESRDVVECVIRMCSAVQRVLDNMYELEGPTPCDKKSCS